MNSPRPYTVYRGLLAFWHACYMHVDRPRHVRRPSTKVPSGIHLRSCPARLGRWIFDSPDHRRSARTHTRPRAYTRVTGAPRVRINTRRQREKETHARRRPTRPPPSRPDKGKVSSRTRAGDINCTNYGRLTCANGRLVPSRAIDGRRRKNDVYLEYFINGIRQIFVAMIWNFKLQVDPKNRLN